MFNVEIKYYGKPMKYDKENGKVTTYKKEYKITNDDDYIKAMRKELTEINKKYEGLYSIKFYLDEITESQL